jgi:membrane protein DedA with SNARE-associated domain
MFDGLLEVVSSSPWTYAAVLAIAALDAVLPIVPSEATVLSAGALAGAGDLSLELVIAAATAGAIVGDNGAYSVGRLLGPRIDARIARYECAVRRRAWAERKLVTDGGKLLLAGRFVPGGRTATSVTAGVVRLRWARFVVLTAIAGTAWASAVGALGFAGGEAVEENPYLGLPLLLGIATALYPSLHVATRLRCQRSPLAA